MHFFKKIITILAFALISTSIYAENQEEFSDNSIYEYENQENAKTLSVLINYNSIYQIEDIPSTGYLEIYSILGLRVKSINLQLCGNECSIELPKGIYILKVGKNAKKILIR